MKHKPKLVFGVGGYSSGPVLKWATILGIPTIIQEQNSYAGVTNKILSKKVNQVCVAYPEMEQFFPKEKIEFTGNPVRKEVVQINGKEEKAFNHFGLDKSKLTILIVGGSLGARSMNEWMSANFDELNEKEYQILWQTGKTGQHFVEELDNKTDKIKIVTFINRMDYAYACSDIIISRAGAIAISELAMVNKPCVLIPFPFAAEDHQTKNAMSLVNKNAARMVKDSELQEKLMETLEELTENEALRNELSLNISLFAKPNAAKDIANYGLKLLDK